MNKTIKCILSGLPIAAGAVGLSLGVVGMSYALYQLLGFYGSIIVQYTALVLFTAYVVGRFKQ